MPDPSAVDRSDEVSSLRAENNELRTQLADANDEIDRLKRLLHEKVIEKIAARLADGETKPTVRDVVSRTWLSPRDTRAYGSGTAAESDCQERLKVAQDALEAARPFGKGLGVERCLTAYWSS
jgi:hypothetical protein